VVDEGSKDDGGDDIVDDATVSNCGGEQWTLEEFCLARAEIYSPWDDWADGCCTDAERDTLEFSLYWQGSTSGFDPDSCIDFFSEYTNNGSIQFDGCAAEACVDALVDAYVAPTPLGCWTETPFDTAYQGRGRPDWTQIPECRQLFAGTLEENEECEASFQCGGNLRCMSNGRGEFRCAPVKAFGEPCSLDSECEYGLMCAGAPNLKSCQGLVGEYGSCSWDYQCEDGLYCEIGEYLCLRPRQQGQSCRSDEPDCVLGTYCDWTTSRCRSFLPDGAQCDYFNRCLGWCDEDAGICRPLCQGS
jgi:hypothetical protein